MNTSITKARFPDGIPTWLLPVREAQHAHRPGVKQSLLQFMMSAAYLFSAMALTAQTWETVDDVEAPVAIATSVATDSAGNVFVYGTIDDAAGVYHAVVMKSDDQGVSWVTSDDVAPSTKLTYGGAGIASARIGSTETGFADHLVTASEVDGTKWIIRRSLDAGITWTTLDLFVHPNSNFDLGSPQSVTIDGNGNIYVSGAATETIRKGKTLTYVNHPVLRKFASGSWSTHSASAVFRKLISVNGSLVGLANTGNSWQVLRSGDGASSWQVLDTYSIAGAYARGWDIAADGQGNLFVVGSGDRVVTTGTGKRATTVFDGTYWAVRKGTGLGTPWETIDFFELGPRTDGYKAFNEAHAVTVDLNNDVHVTGTGIDHTGRNWVTRQLSATTGQWTTTDKYKPAYPAEGNGIAADPWGNLFAIGGDARQDLRWTVRRKVSN